LSEDGPPGPPKALSRQARGQRPAGLSSRSPRFPRQVGPAEAGGGLSRLPPIALSPVVGRLRQAALRQSRPRAPLPRAVHPPRGHLPPSARRRDARRGLVSLEGLPARQSDTDAHARRRRVSPSLPGTRLTEALLRIRYFGFLASRPRTPQLAQCRQ